MRGRGSSRAGRGRRVRRRRSARSAAHLERTAPADDLHTRDRRVRPRVEPRLRVRRRRGCLPLVPEPVTYRGLSRSTHTFRVRAVRPRRGDGSAVVVLVDDRCASAADLGRGSAAAGDDDRTGAAVDLEERDVRLALAAGDDAPSAGSTRRAGSVARTRRRTSASVSEQHVFRVRARSATGRRSSVNRFTWTITRDAAASSADDHVRPRRLDDVDGRHVRVLRRRRRRSRVPARRRALAPVLEPGRLRRPVRRHPRVLRSRESHRTGRSARRRVAPGRSRRARPRSRRSLHDVGGPSRSASRPEAAATLPLTVTNPYDFPLRVTEPPRHRSRRDARSPAVTA